MLIHLSEDRRNGKLRTRTPTMEGQHLFETLRRLFNLKNIYRMENVGTPLEAFDLEKGPTVKSRDL